MGYIKQIYGQHYTKWGKMRAFSLKSGVSREYLFSLLIQHLYAFGVLPRES